MGIFSPSPGPALNESPFFSKKTNWVYKNKGIDVISSKIWDGEEEEEEMGMEKKKKIKKWVTGEEDLERGYHRRQGGSLIRKISV